MGFLLPQNPIWHILLFSVCNIFFLTRRFLSSSMVLSSWENSFNDWAVKEVIHLQHGNTDPTLQLKLLPKFLGLTYVDLIISLCIADTFKLELLQRLREALNRKRQTCMKKDKEKYSCSKVTKKLSYTWGQIIYLFCRYFLNEHYLTCMKSNSNPTANLCSELWSKVQKKNGTLQFENLGKDIWEDLIWDVLKNTTIDAAHNLQKVRLEMQKRTCPGCFSLRIIISKGQPITPSS